MLTKLELIAKEVIYPMKNPGKSSNDLIIAMIMLASSMGAVAHDDTPCTKEAENRWQPFSLALKKAEDLGHSVKNAEVHHRCYELRGKTKDGKRFEWILDPVTLEPRTNKK